MYIIELSWTPIVVTPSFHGVTPVTPAYWALRGPKSEENARTKEVKKL